jgi:hypothetical protein
MCTGLELALIAGSTGLSVANQQGAKRQQERIASDALRRNSLLNKEAGRRVSDEVQRVADSGPEGEVQDANADFMAALKRARVEEGGDALAGAGSDRFSDDLDLARTAAGAEGKRTADILARIDAPQLQRQREGASLNRAATDLQLIGDRGQGGDFLDQLRMARAQPNAGIDALASLGGAYGTARAGRMKRPAPTMYTMTPSETADITRGFRP